TLARLNTQVIAFGKAKVFAVSKELYLREKACDHFGGSICRGIIDHDSLYGVSGGRGRQTVQAFLQLALIIPTENNNGNIHIQTMREKRRFSKLACAASEKMRRPIVFLPASWPPGGDHGQDPRHPCTRNSERRCTSQTVVCVSRPRLKGLA